MEATAFVPAPAVAGLFALLLHLRHYYYCSCDAEWSWEPTDNWNCSFLKETHQAP